MKRCLPVLSIAVTLSWLAIPALAAEAGAAMPPIAERVKLPAWPEPAVVLHVAPGGSDEASGTAEAPFATLERARDMLRALKKEGRLAHGGAVVVIHGGDYQVSQTFVLSAEDSGEASAPIRYEAVGGETPVFRGGIRIDQFEKVTDEAILSQWPEEVRGKVVQTRLAQYGIGDLKPLRLGGFNSGLGFETHPTVELFFNGEPMTLARWPNEGFVQVAGVAVEDGHSIHGLKAARSAGCSMKASAPRDGKMSRRSRFTATGFSAGRIHTSGWLQSTPSGMNLCWKNLIAATGTGPVRRIMPSIC